jgi:hypothetical protein
MVDIFLIKHATEPCSVYGFLIKLRGSNNLVDVRGQCDLKSIYKNTTLNTTTTQQKNGVPLDNIAAHIEWLQLMSLPSTMS